jgi:hypothetical protein
MKGQLANMMSKARFTEGDWRVQYRDFKELIDLPVAEFWKIASIIPEHRIARIYGIPKLPPSSEEYGQSELLFESSDSNLTALPIVTRDTVDEETLRFVAGRDALSVRGPWHRYLELEPIKRLKEEGRELLGEYIYIQEKRDGENLSMWLEEQRDKALKAKLSLTINGKTYPIIPTVRGNETRK